MRSYLSGAWLKPQYTYVHTQNHGSTVLTSCRLSGNCTCKEWDIQMEMLAWTLRLDWQGCICMTTSRRQCLVHRGLWSTSFLVFPALYTDDEGLRGQNFLQSVVRLIDSATCLLIKIDLLVITTQQSLYNINILVIVQLIYITYCTRVAVVEHNQLQCQVQTPFPLYAV